MSVSEVKWDRRLADRRAEAMGTDRRRAESPLGRFEAFVDTHLRELEHAAAETAGQVGAEARKVSAELPMGQFDREAIDGLSQRLSRLAEGMAEELARARAEITAAAASDHDESVAEPSLGAELLVRQLAAAGADASEIEAELANLGMEHPREAIDTILVNAQPPE
jgi:hypothetical protein